jgi:hypothetical protein
VVKWNIGALHLSTLRDDDILVWLVLCCTRVLNLVNNIHTFDDLSEDDMLVVEEWSWNSGDEELTSISICTGILVKACS